MTQIKYLFDKGYGLELPDLDRDSYAIGHFAKHCGIEPEAVIIGNHVDGGKLITLPEGVDLEHIGKAIKEFSQFNGSLIIFGGTIRVHIEGKYVPIPEEELKTYTSKALKELIELSKGIYGKYYQGKEYAMKRTNLFASRIIWWNKLSKKQQQFIEQYEEAKKTISYEDFGKALDLLGISLTENQSRILRDVYCGAFIDDRGYNYQQYTLYAPKRKTYGDSIWDDLDNLHHATIPILKRKNMIVDGEVFDRPQWSKDNRRKRYVISQIIKKSLDLAIKELSKESEETDS